MTLHSAEPERNAATTVRVEQRTLHERRRRVWQSVAFIVLATLVMVLLSIRNRDEAAIRDCRAHMDMICAAFQEALDQGRPMPSLLPPVFDRPELRDERQKLMCFDHVRYNVLHERGVGMARESGLCCCRWSHTRLFGPSGRCVIVFNVPAHCYEVRWMNESAFDGVADLLGLGEATGH